MVQGPTEVEAKFLATDSKICDAIALLAVMHTWSVIEAYDEEQLNTGLDTAAYDLRRHGVMLRVREVAGAVEVTCKRARRYVHGVAERLELNASVPRGMMHDVLTMTLDCEPLRYVRPLVANGVLEPIYVFRTHRRVRRLQQDDMTIEIDIDQMAVLRGHAVIASRMEIEVENHTATPEAFEQLLAWLQSTYGAALTPCAESKSHFALQHTQRDR